MITMEFTFVDETGRDITARAEGAGYVWADYFRDGLEGLAAAQSVEQADRVLRAAYKGADWDGIGVIWTLKKAI